MPTRSKLTSKGQVTIPRSIRKRLDLRQGDSLEFTIGEDGRLVVRPTAPKSEAFGSLSDFARDEPVSVEEMNRAIRARAGGAGRTTE